jgi:predicted dinucleotide-binding enzyme
VGPNTTTVLVAGDDDDAKAALVSAVEAGVSTLSTPAG